jgi:hypothetical protein
VAKLLSPTRAAVDVMSRLNCGSVYTYLDALRELDEPTMRRLMAEGT